MPDQDAVARFIERFAGGLADAGMPDGFSTTFSFNVGQASTAEPMAALIRESLAKIVQQYPRTDAAAAATVALVSLGHQERKDLERAVIMLTRRNEQQTKLISDLQKSVTELRNAPPKIVTVTAPPPPKPAPKKKAPVRRRRR